MSDVSESDLNLSLKGRVALVCGASTGIGAAAAKLLSQQGATVVALARGEESLKSVTRGLEKAETLAVDLNDHSKLGLKLDEVLKRLGPITILLNNSAGPKGGPISEAKPEEFTAAFHQHLLTNHFLMQKLVPGMRAEKFGRIINVISTSVYAPISGLGVSNTIRGSVASWAKTLSLELGASGITVNSVLPGYTNTPRLAALMKAAAERRNVSESVIAEEWKNVTPLKRFAEPEEVASAIAFLASPAAGFITGVALPVDGGRLPVI